MAKPDELIGKLVGVSLKPHEGPLFSQVKQLIVDRIESGQWPPHTRVPSENELVATLGISKLTAHRALRELAVEGYLKRVRGIGTFVASRRAQAGLLEIRPISDEIRERGGLHTCRVHLLTLENASGSVASALEIPAGAPVFHSIMVHRENNLPLQLADRYVNPVLAPDYLDQDFTRITPSHYLFERCRMVEAEHVVESAMPDHQAQQWLEIGPNESCLIVRRRTWDESGRISTVVTLTHPASRYHLAGRIRTEAHHRTLVS
jgi:GntR family histidine utilization transcriptional repressor